MQGPAAESLTGHRAPPARSLAELLAGLDGEPFGSWEGVQVRGLAIDSRRVEPGDLFFALAGLHTHGARFVEQARSKGAVAVVVPADGPGGGDGAQASWGLPGLAVADARAALAAVSARFYGEPARSLRVVGVTGTNGKSTVVHMVAQLLEAAGRPVGIWSTPVVDSGVRRFRPQLTTPEAPDLHRFFWECRMSGRTAACVEVSSHGVALGRVAGVPFGVGVVTNVSPDHLDFHGTLEAYAQAKEGFVAQLPPGGTCVLNADDRRVRAMSRSSRARVLLYGFAPDAHVRAVEWTAREAGAAATVVLQGPAADLAGQAGVSRSRGGWPLQLRLPIPGRHNVLNALAALGAGLAAGVGAGEALEALLRFRPPARRLETVRIGPYTVVNDVAMNEASYDAVLQTMADLRALPLVVVHALRGNRGPQVNAAIAAVLARWNRRLGFSPLIVTSSRSHVLAYAADYRVRPEELEAFLAAARQGGLPCVVHEELPDAIAEGVARLRPGGVLLLLGTFGMDEGAALARAMLQRALARG